MKAEALANYLPGQGTERLLLIQEPFQGFGETTLPFPQGSALDARNPGLQFMNAFSVFDSS
ncbi:MAG TPA: hypothetical protein VHQ64_18410, partial [Pyrinomonadaceae bacterium]|nr:hypothetical protein [Pyrinomonadaceae bacterium]